MGLSNLQGFSQRAIRTAARFPFAVTDAFVGTVLALIIVDGSKGNEEIIKALMSLALGLPLFISLELIAEAREWARTKALVLSLIGVLAYYLTLSDISGLATGIRLLILIVGLVLTVTIAPFPWKPSFEGFWQYNSDLFHAAVTATGAATIIFAGVSVAFAGMDYLLAIEIPSRLYFRLFIISFGLIGVIAFLAGIPERPRDLNAIERYTRRLEVFARFIYIPLAVLYLVILYAYIGKIVATMNWPKGGVSVFILGFSAVGIISMLLIYPIRDTVDNKVIRAYVKWLYPATLPLSIVMFLAVWRRVSEYGVTESRYFGILASFWLAAISLYFILSKAKSLKIIPLSLCTILFLSSFGPWGALSVSEQSQIERLKALLEKNSILISGKMQKVDKPIPAEDEVEISKLVQYLGDVHNLKGIRSWISSNLQTVSSHDRPKFVVELMGLNYIPYGSGDKRYFSFLSEGIVPIRVTGYDYYLRFGYYEDVRGNTPPALKIDNKSIGFTWAQDRNLFQITTNGQVAREVDLSIIVRRLLADYKDSALNRHSVPREAMMLEETVEDVKMTILFSEINGYGDDMTINVSNVKADILVRVP